VFKKFFKNELTIIIFMIVIIVSLATIGELTTRKTNNKYKAEMENIVTDLTNDTIKYCNLFSEKETLEWKHKNPDVSFDDVIVHQKTQFDLCISVKFQNLMYTLIDTMYQQ